MTRTGEHTAQQQRGFCGDSSSCPGVAAFCGFLALCASERENKKLTKITSPTRINKPVREKVKTSTPTAHTNKIHSTVIHLKRHAKTLFRVMIEASNQGSRRKQICSANHFGS